MFLQPFFPLDQLLFRGWGFQLTILPDQLRMPLVVKGLDQKCLLLFMAIQPAETVSVDRYQVRVFL